MKRITALSVFVLIAAVGCRSQVPPATQHTVVLNFTAPVTTDVTKWKGCAGVQGSASDALPCVYGAYRCSLSQAACGDTTNVAWNEITTPATRFSGLTYTDSTVSGGTYWYVVKTFQGTGSSGPSNISQAIVPGVPTAPALNNTVASIDTKPLISVPDAQGLVIALLTAPALKAKVR